MTDTISSAEVNSVERLSVAQMLQLSAASYGGRFEAQLAGVAVNILISRIVQLPKEDQDDLFACFKDLATIKTEQDATDTMDTILEIIDPEIKFDGCVAVEDLPEELPCQTLESWLVWISQKIKEARREGSMTQEQLSEKTGIPQSHISRLEGGIHSPSHKTLQKIADALNIDVKQFTLEIE